MRKPFRSRSAKRRSKSPAVVPMSHQYAAISVLLLSWKDDDLGVSTEIEELDEVLTAVYGYHVDKAFIPTQDADAWLERTFIQFVSRWESKDTLLIVYYGGHGYLDRARALHWRPTQRSMMPDVTWYVHQRHLEQSASDVLLLLDCCEADGISGLIKEGTVKEVIGAASFGRAAPGVGPHSFTRALISELLSCHDRSVSAIGLYNNIKRRLRSEPSIGLFEQREPAAYYHLGEDDNSQSRISLASYIAFPQYLIAVMGATGTGKSSFINAACGKARLAVGHSQTSQTDDVSLSVAIINGRSVTLVDTPGFHDTHLSDTEVLRRIASFLHDRYKNAQKLTGILYLRNIHEDKMTGPAVQNLGMFVLLCGEEYMSNVILVTTKWDKYKDDDKSVLIEREEDLKLNFWKEMFDSGCAYSQYYRNSGHEKEILMSMIKFDGEWLQIQEEMGQGYNLEETTAGRKLMENFGARLHEYEVKIADLQAALDQAQSRAVRQSIQVGEKICLDQSDKVKQDRERLNATPSELVDQESRRRWDHWKAKFKQWRDDMDSDSEMNRSPEESARAQKVRKLTYITFIATSLVSIASVLIAQLTED